MTNTCACLTCQLLEARYLPIFDDENGRTVAWVRDDEATVRERTPDGRPVLRLPDAERAPEVLTRLAVGEGVGTALRPPDSTLSHPSPVATRPPGGLSRDRA